MTLRELINNVEKTEENEYKDGIIEDLVFYIKRETSYTAIESKRLKAYYLREINSRKLINVKLLFLDDAFIAISEKNGNGAETYQWKSVEAFEETRNYIYSYFKEEMPMIAIINLDEEISFKTHIIW